ncbi:MAG: hypothetical protein U0174_14590 [Polyangiaceae bacterium]
MRMRLRVLSLSTLFTLSISLPEALAAGEPPAPEAPKAATPAGAPAPAPTAQPGARPAEEPPLSTVGTGLAPATAPAPVAPSAAVPAERHEDPPKKTDETPKFEFGTLLQPQFVDTLYNSQASPNNDPVSGVLPNGIAANDVIAKSDGSTTNAMGFRMRRTRLIFKVNPVPEASAKVDVELLPFLTPGVFWRDAFVTGRAKWSPNVISEFNVGSFKVPFNGEEIESSRTRPFIERSIGTRVFFPGDRDIGIWMHTRIFKKLNIDLAVVNGVTQGEAAYTLMPDLNRAKDFSMYVNYNFGPVDIGASFYGGAGQLVDGKGLRTKSYARYAGHAEVAIHHTFVKALGPTYLYFDGTLARNMDRGTIFTYGPPSIPASINDDASFQKTGIAAMARFEQRLSPRFIGGFRYDMYTPELSGGTNTYHGFTPMFGIFLIEQLRWSAEYSFIRDDTHAPGGRPAGRQIQVITTYLHANFEL